MSLPPEILLRPFGTEGVEIEQDGSIEAQLTACMISRPIFRGIAPDTEKITPWLRNALEKYVDLYRSFLRPVLQDCLVFHHTPFQAVTKGAPYTILEYMSADEKKGILAIFNQLANEEEIHVYPRGLKRRQCYHVRWADSGESVLISGNILNENGLRIRLRQRMSAQLILFEEAEHIVE